MGFTPVPENQRNIDGVSVTIELGHDDGEQTIHLLKELIGELDNGWNAPHGITLLPRVGIASN